MGKSSPPKFETVAIVGVGLIGASIGLGLRERKAARRVIGIGRRESRLRVAFERGAVSEITTDLAAGVAQADLVIVCTPVDEIVKFVLDAAVHGPPHAVLTDVGSTKEHLVRALDRSLNRPAAARSKREPGRPGPRFLGSHPLAGSEKTGPEHARGDLLVGRVTVLTPTRYTPPELVARLGGFWSSLGARVVELDPGQHDVALAATSHLPHLVAAALAGATPQEFLELTAGGWLDTTRIAGGDVEMWCQIFADNRRHVLKSLGKFEKVLSSFRQALEKQDDARLRMLLQSGKDRRDSVGN